MKNYDRLCLTTAVGVCLAMVVFCTGWTCGSKYSKQHANTEYRIDTIRVKPDTVIVSSPVLTKEIPCSTPSEVDTSAILAKFYTKRAFADTLQLQNFGSVTLVDTVIMNGIDSRHYNYSLAFPSHQKVLNKWSYGIGAFVHREGSGAYGTVRYRHLQVMGGYDFISKSTLFGVQYMF